MAIEKCHRCVGSQACQNQVVKECLPVSAFGNVSGKSVKVATIGLNPVLNEFYHPPNYTTLKNRSQRLAALSDYELTSRADLQVADVKDEKDRREKYFVDDDRQCHSYFNRLQNRINGIQPLWSFVSGRVVHIDLVACATRVRWGRLSGGCQKELIGNCRENFCSTLSQLPNGTILLPVNSEVIAEIEKLGLIPEQDRDFIGKLNLGKKVFPVASLP
jgi:hypothetical protein